MLAAFVHWLPTLPNHIAYLCSWGLTHLPRTCNAKLFGYSDSNVDMFIQIVVAVCARFPHDNQYTISLFPPWFDADEQPFDLAQ
ncbi:hypothetical protein D8T45_22720 [Vibrio vulnificus]|nr:hypothetical protein D8T45_22720 [Vibrio vulnificus]RZR17334.1 hypothetical protein D8T24_06245 [Vibrio vulnificus]